MPDIIILQEVDRYEFLEPKLREFGELDNKFFKEVIFVITSVSSFERRICQADYKILK